MFCNLKPKTGNIRLWLKIYPKNDDGENDHVRQAYENYNDIKIGDIVEGYDEVEVKRSL